VDESDGVGAEGQGVVDVPCLVDRIAEGQGFNAMRTSEGGRAYLMPDI
jgi:hypothetical protein